MYSKIYVYFMCMIFISMLFMILWSNIFMNMSMFTEMKFMFFLNSKMGFLMMFDSKSILFFQTVFLITGMVYFFSNFYMNFSKSFLILTFMFFMSMIMLIFSINMFSLLLGWDGLGITSFLLIIYYKNFYSTMASISTFLITRSGDLLIILIMINNLKSINSIKNMLMSKMMTFLIIMAFLTKSAQYPFISWLPMAMAAPTPISSLVHSSTLVTAGIYEIMRLEFLMSKNFFLMFIFMGIFTMTMASFFAMSEMDFKKMVAMSTLSQMGLLTMLIFLNEKEYCMFHLISHALFKSFLFMKVGYMMKLNNSEQDKRLMEINMNMYPSMMFMVTICNMSMMGTPFLSGFFIKDFIYNSIMKFDQMFFMLLIFLYSSILTMVYSIKIIKEMWFKNSKGNKFKFEKLDNKYKMIMILISSKIIFLGLYMEMILQMEDIFLMFCRDKMYILIIYTFALASFWMMNDFSKLIKNFFCSMMFMEFWMFKYFFKKYKFMEKLFFESLWSENINKFSKMIFKKTMLTEIFSIPLMMMIIMNLFLC